MPENDAKIASGNCGDTTTCGSSSGHGCSADEVMKVAIPYSLFLIVLMAAEENTAECLRDYEEKYAGYTDLQKCRRVIDLYDEQLKAVKEVKAYMPNATGERPETRSEDV